MQNVQILGVNLVAEGVEIAYLRLPEDVRKNGLVQQHSLLIPRGSDYDDELEAFEEALRALLDDATDDLLTAEPVELADDEDEEDD